MTLPLLIAGIVSCVLSVGACVLLGYFGERLPASGPLIGEPFVPGEGFSLAATSTPRPRPSRTPTSAVPTCAQRPGSWVRAEDDHFALSKNDWPIGLEEASGAESDLEMAGGVLRLTLRGPQESYAYRLPNDVDAQRDFYALMNVREAQGPDDSEFGMIVRASDEGHYFFGINKLAEYVIRRRGSGGWEEDLLHGFFDGPRPGGFTEMVVYAEGRELTFCVNKELVAMIENDAYPEGKIGIAVVAGEGSEPAVIEYDDYVVFAPEK